MAATLLEMWAGGVTALDVAGATVYLRPLPAAPARMPYPYAPREQGGTARARLTRQPSAWPLARGS